MRIDIIRVTDKTDGVVLIDDEAFCVSLEETWKDNGADSCIPIGHYTAHKRFFDDGRAWRWQLDNVPGRTYIQIHSGKDRDDTLGCILFGSSFAKMHGDRLLLNSGETMRHFRDLTVNEHTIDIYISEAVIPVMV